MYTSLSLLSLSSPSSCVFQGNKRFLNDENNNDDDSKRPHLEGNS